MTLLSRSSLRPATLLPLLALLLLLTGCGFQLRGMVSIPESLRLVHIVSAQDSALVRTLEDNLRVNGVQLSAEAPLRIEILDEHHSRRTLSLDRGARAAEYELRSEVVFRVVDAEGVERLSERRLYSERSYAVDADNITASESQEPILRRQMQQDLAQQIVRQYTRLSP